MKLLINSVLDARDRAIITLLYQRITKFGRTCFFGNSVEKRKEEFEEIRITEEDEREIEKLKRQPDVYKKLISSIAPSIYGYLEIKEAILLQLFGDDPGIGKSNLLSHILKLAPRGLYAARSSSSGVGLTAAAVRVRNVETLSEMKIAYVYDAVCGAPPHDSASPVRA